MFPPHIGNDIKHSDEQGVPFALPRSRSQDSAYSRFVIAELLSGGKTSFNFMCVVRYLELRYGWWSMVDDK